MSLYFGYGHSGLLTKLGRIVHNFKCTDKPNVAFGLVLKTTADVSCRYYYAQGRITQLDYSKQLVVSKKKDVRSQQSDGSDQCQ